MVEAKYGHTLNLNVNNTDYFKFSYYEQQMVSGESIDSVWSLKDMQDIVHYVGVFNNRLRNKEWYSVPVDGLELSPGYSLEITWPTADTVKMELIIGDLTLEVTYDMVAKTYAVERTSFNLSWADYIWYIDNWKWFVCNCGPFQ